MNNRMLKLGLCLLLCLCMTVAWAASAWAAAGDEIRAAKKIISVVYDDSGSMQNNGRYVYANYATQALAALLNEQDELYITYMSAPGKSNAMDLRNIRDTVAAIRKITFGGSTPEQAIDTAYSRLSDSKEKDRTTQFWLVVMTDGEVQIDSSHNLAADALRSKLTGYAGTSMSNGSPLNVIYFSMGSGLVLTPDAAGGFYSYSAQDSREISAEIQKLAALISGRITADRVDMPDSTTVVFSSDLPLYSISVLSQNSAAEVSSAEAKGTKLTCRNVALEKTGALRLNGNAATLYAQDPSGTQQVIPAGAYTVHLSAAVDAAQLTVQYEPAIGMKAVLSQNGQTVSDTADLIQGDKVTVSLLPVVPGTDQEIPLSDLPAGIEWSIACEMNGKQVASNNSRSLDGIELEMGETLIRGSMQIPGFTPLVYELSLDVSESFTNLGIEVEQPDSLSYKRTDIAGFLTQEHVKFYITSNGERLTPEQLKRSGLSLQLADLSLDGGDPKPVVCALKQEDDGGFVLRPRAKVPFGACFIREGGYRATVSLVQDDSITAEGSFAAVSSGISDYIQPLILLVIAYFLFLLIWNHLIKHTFRRTIVASDTYLIIPDEGGKHYSGPSIRRLGWLTGNFLLIPLRASKVKFQGLELVAGEDGIVIITGKSISSRCAAYGQSDRNPLNYADNIAGKLIPTTDPKGKKRVAPDRNLSNTPIYFQDNLQSRYIWNIYRR